jgi:glycosyltransferase involved in cell wall biosynthesis
MVRAPGLDLVVAGNDEENYWPAMQTRAEELGISGRVHRLDYVEGVAKISLLANAVLLALPSYSENFGNVVLESMAAGTPVVVTPEVGAASIVSASGAGIVTSGDPAALGKAICALGDDPAAREAMSRNARKAVEGLGWDAIAHRFEKEYQALLSAPAAA